MKIHEYQAKAIFKEAGLRVPSGKVFDRNTLSEADIAALGSDPLVVKAQIHAGGRGKAGGVKIVKTSKEAFQFAKELIGKTLVTFQTAGVGQPVNQVLVERASILKRELYLAAVLDRERARPCIIFSEMGGMEIEEVAKASPEHILKLYFDPRKGVSENEAKTFLANTKVTTDQREKIASVLRGIAQILITRDASLVEINPLGVLENGEINIVDGKILFDDNALYRRPEIAALRDVSQEDPREVDAKKFDLSYVGLQGNIGCMVNGAGLAMATMDIIKFYGGEPANFLDVGGGATVEKVTAAFKIILRDPHVRAILVNIFGGIMKCDVVAQGILAAIREINLKVPLVVRLEGTNVKEGMKILKESGLQLTVADGFADAAQKVVKAAK